MYEFNYGKFPLIYDVFNYKKYAIKTPYTVRTIQISVHV